VTDVGAYFPHSVTYHPTCHSMRFLKVGARPLKLLRAVEGLEMKNLPESDTCCGFGGTFSVKNDATSDAMVTDKAANVERSGAEFVVAGDASCLMNIGGKLRRTGAEPRSVHLAQILASTREDRIVPAEMILGWASRPPTVDELRGTSGRRRRHDHLLSTNCEERAGGDGVMTTSCRRTARNEREE